MTTIDPEIQEIGLSLLQYAQDLENFTAQRGLVDELFPYIYQASRRMSTRAISKFLKDNFKVKLSAVTVAKALREPDKYWLAWYEEIEPAARVVAEAHDIDVEDLLELEAGAYYSLKNEPPTLTTSRGRNDALEKSLEYEGAVSILEAQWFSFDEDCRNTCLASIPKDSEDEEDEKKGAGQSSK